MSPSIKGVMIEMPKYKCSKEVWALKIIEILKESESKEFPRATLIVEFPYSPIEVNDDFMLKHNPQVGGYYVVYKDGYKSFSPAKAFEEGYTKI